MRSPKPHSWNVTPAEARMIQQRLRSLVIDRDDFDRIRTVAGADACFEKREGMTRAAVAVLTFPALELEEYSAACSRTGFPYIPGLLSFREAPAVLQALEKLRRPPDLLLCDGQGLAHPRRFGLACHIGVLGGIPSIGVAKTRFVGTHGEVPDRRGAWLPLMDGPEVIGAVVRTRTGVKPVYVSIGHRVSLESAIDFVLRCAPRFRLPEPTRWAHRLAEEEGVPKRL